MVNNQVRTSAVDVLMVSHRLIAFDFRSEDLCIGVVIEYDLDSREKTLFKIGHLVSIYRREEYADLFMEVLEKESSGGIKCRVRIPEEKFNYFQNFLRLGKDVCSRRVFREFRQFFPDVMKAYLEM